VVGVRPPLPCHFKMLTLGFIDLCWYCCLRAQWAGCFGRDWLLSVLGLSIYYTMACIWYVRGYESWNTPEIVMSTVVPDGEQPKELTASYVYVYVTE
jgi:hypothetical protein